MPPQPNSPNNMPTYSFGPAPESGPSQPPQPLGPPPEPVSPPPQPVFQPEQPAFSPPPVKRSRRKLLLLIAIPLVALIGASAAAYFGYYAPNQPDNLWKTALTRTGKGYDKLTDYTVAQIKSKNTGLKLDGSFKISG